MHRQVLKSLLTPERDLGRSPAKLGQACKPIPGVFDEGCITAVELPAEETERRWQATTPQ